VGLSVLHLIQCLSRGGPTRALIGAISAAEGSGIGHRVVSLEPAAPKGAALVRQRGITVIDHPHQAVLWRELERAEIVHVYFWNTPELYAVLTGPLPPMRLLISCRVAGEHPPQVLTRELMSFADLTVASTPYTAELRTFRDAAGPTTVIPAAGGWDRVRDVSQKPHRSFNVGYVGTVDFVKMHPRHVAMSARINVPDARFIVCGTGNGFATLARQAATLGVSERFDFRGYIEDVASVFAELDVFGYPLCEENYSGSELVLQEAMYCGVPPVVLPYGGAQRSVVPGHTGLVVDNEDGYVRAIEGLHADPSLRQRMGRAAAEHARATWNVEEVAARWTETYERLAAEGKRARRWPDVPDSPGAWRAPAAARFVQSLGGTAPEFETSLVESDVERVLVAEKRIAAATPALASADGGGVLHWRRRHSRDPWLRLWAGLVLHGQGRSVLAAGEFQAALRLGLDDSRTTSYLARSVKLAGGRDVSH
jgi:glycosyltransferase involved in cell wall biosynthesis